MDMDNFRALCRKIEDYTERVFQPLRPHLSAIGGFLIVASFIDYGSKGIIQWDDCIWTPYRYNGLSRDLSRLFHLVDVVIQLGGSGMVVLDWHSDYAALHLIGIWVAHELGYDTPMNPHLWWITLSRPAGLALVLIDGAVKRGRLPAERRQQLFWGVRALLILTFSEWLFRRSRPLLFTIFGLSACTMLAVGPTHRWPAAILVLALLNELLPRFLLSKRRDHGWEPNKELELYPALSLIGGLVLLENMGALGEV
ncbi:SURF4-domain-containing protein [Mycena venus]|uniref:SURF4-domain-containing protein n=1 Tax=Mycena venus TaxID=2733690 RepID=A0A8H7CVS5_9AGAR|nr:SURF4-domain-containing protein [Mycena venus]